MRDTDRRLLEGRNRRVAVLPTAAGLEGDERVRYWLDLARRHYDDLGADVVEVAVLQRDHADVHEWVEAIEGVGLVYLSGGNPHHVTAALTDTAVWRAVRAAWESGAALAGCSAGAMTLAQTVVSLRGAPQMAGLGLVPGICVIPHFDAFARRFPELVDRTRTEVREMIVGIDEDTALVGGPQTWVVEGRGQVHVYQLDGSVQRFLAGATVELPAS